MNTIRLTEL
ncbi:unnamed protein product, partial [Rotaria sp. Silwood1]